MLNFVLLYHIFEADTTVKTQTDVAPAV